MSATWEVIEGDCLEVMRGLPDGSVDCCITSPPYNHLGPKYSRGGGMHAGKKCVNQWLSNSDAVMYQDEQSESEYTEWIAQVLMEMMRVTKGLVWVNHKTRYRDGEGIHPLSFLSARLYAEVVWDKGGSMALNCRRFAPSHEYLYAFGKPIFWDDSMNGLCSVWRIGQVTGSEHPCPFPEELVRRPIRASCPPGGLVLDPFCGSGTTGAVALQEGRRFCGIEFMPEYAAMARRRIGQAQSPLFAD